MKSSVRHSTQLPYDAAKSGTSVDNFVRGKNVYVTEVDDYDRYRSMLYALGAQSVTSKMMANVNLVLFGRSEIPVKAKNKYPTGEFVRAGGVIDVFHSEIESFGAFVRALRQNGFTVRNPSDEGDPHFDFFDLPLVDDSLSETLLHYLRNSPFIRKFATKQHFPIDNREAGYVEFPIPDTDLTWYYQWRVDAWSRVSAFRGEGEYPLEIKGEQLLRIAPLVWSENTGMYFHEYPHIDSINGLFIVGGIDARTKNANGVAISRVWT